MTKLLHCCNSKLAPYFYTLRRSQPLSALPVMFVKELGESTFYVNRSRVTWRVLIFDEQIAKTDENKFSISAYIFEYTKRWGAQLYIRWYIDTYRWHGQFDVYH